MSPDVVRAKLSLLQQVLVDLAPHVEASREEQEEHHYEIERQVQLAVDQCVAIARRFLIIKQVPLPDTNRELFVLIGKEKIVPTPLSRALADAVGLRNLLVHEYGSIDYGIFFGGLKSGYEAFLQFSKVVRQFLEK